MQMKFLNFFKKLKFKYIKKDLKNKKEFLGVESDFKTLNIILKNK
jgi:hypothetical protein